MHPFRIAVIVLTIIGAFALFNAFLTQTLVPDEGDLSQQAYDSARPRAPKEARALKNPYVASAEVVADGAAIYRGRGNCSVCHGDTGRGDGAGGAMLRPAPRDFTDIQFHRGRTDGELFWVIKFGVPSTGMMSYTPRMISEAEAWRVVHYLRTLASDEGAVLRTPADAGIERTTQAPTFPPPLAGEG